MSATNDQDGQDALEVWLEIVAASENCSEWLNAHKTEIEHDKMMATPRHQFGGFTKADPDDFSDDELLQEWSDYLNGRQTLR